MCLTDVAPYAQYRWLVYGPKTTEYDQILLIQQSCQWLCDNVSYMNINIAI